MKNLKNFLLFTALLLIFPLACKKDALLKEVSQESTTDKDGLVEFNVTDPAIGTRSDEDENVKTVLGNLRQNPFTVETMALAHNNLYGSSISRMETTHLYVKFLPASMDDIKTLDSIGLVLFDFPLEYEVVEMGDYYQEIKEGTFPVLYAVVEPDFVFPNVAHELIANLYLNKSDPFLLAESFRLTGNTNKIVPYVFPTTGLRLDELGGNQVFLDVPEQPECDPG